MAVNRFISFVRPTPPRPADEAAAGAAHATLYDFASKNAPAKAADAYIGPDAANLENVVGGGRPMAQAAEIAPPPIRGIRRFSDVG